MQKQLEITSESCPAYLLIVHVQVEFSFFDFFSPLEKKKQRHTVQNSVQYTVASNSSIVPHYKLYSHEHKTKHWKHKHVYFELYTPFAAICYKIRFKKGKRKKRRKKNRMIESMSIPFHQILLRHGIQCANSTHDWQNRNMYVCHYDLCDFAILRLQIVIAVQYSLCPLHLPRFARARIYFS